MTNTESQPRVELKAIERERSRIVLTSVLALVFLVVVYILLKPPPSAVVVVAIIILVALKKAAVRYQDLGKAKAELVDQNHSQTMSRS